MRGQAAAGACCDKVSVTQGPQGHLSLGVPARLLSESTGERPRRSPAFVHTDGAGPARIALTPLQGLQGHRASVHCPQNSTEGLPPERKPASHDVSSMVKLLCKSNLFVYFKRFAFSKATGAECECRCARCVSHFGADVSSSGFWMWRHRAGQQSGRCCPQPGRQWMPFHGQDSNLSWSLCEQ